MTIIYIILSVLFVLSIYKFAYTQGYEFGRDYDLFCKEMERELNEENSRNN
jgi:hypothetical protein